MQQKEFCANTSGLLLYSKYRVIAKYGNNDFLRRDEGIFENVLKEAGNRPGYLFL